MVMSYVGALKARIWAVIFKVWRPSAASVRVPAILLGALSIWWLYGLMTRTLGVRAALASAALLATDPIYVLYSRWDQGPAVIQHLCLIGAMLALVRFHQVRRAAWLAAGFLALGLGLWDKAIFEWVMSGTAVAALILFPRQIRHSVRARTAGIAFAAFALGALPLIVYNARQGLRTIRDNTVWSPENIPGKVDVLRGTLEGNVLFGEMMYDQPEGPQRAPSTAGEKATVGISRALGMPRRSWMGYLAIASLLAVPLVWRSPARTAALFALIAMAVAWLQMAFTKGAGVAGHHTILLWPLPALGIGAVLAEGSRRVRLGWAALIAIVAVACASNLAVLNTYYAKLLLNGGTPSWTDAMYPALDAIHKMPKDGVCTIDWGFIDTVRLFERGRTELCGAPNLADPSDEAQGVALWQIGHPKYVFLTHTEGNESFPGRTVHYVQFAESRGFRVVNRRVFADSNGRNMVEMFQFAKDSH
jgi:4-amino-4-deoxy-L-arabinose transferase-like glycosyltransferase